MILIKGTFNEAKVFTDDLEETARLQIRELLEQDFVRGSKIRIMPDVHAGAGCTIGTTMTIEDKLVPNLVGVDIGCGVEVVELGRVELDFQRLDRLIKSSIPSGFKTRRDPHPYLAEADLSKLLCKGEKMRLDRAERSLGTLGGGNHFIEIGQDEEENYYLLIHSGSRHLGYQVAGYYQKLAAKKNKKVPRDLAYLEGQDSRDYLSDMQLMQDYAHWNRRAMAEVILRGMGFEALSRFDTVHNYIDMESKILRKGAVSAKKGEVFLLPMNMRDGSFICRGKGNSDWNYSAPHGAGRILSRTQARKDLEVRDFHEDMKGIFSTSVGPRTLDESPRAYKEAEDILRHVEDTLEILRHLRVVYNYKSSN